MRVKTRYSVPALLGLAMLMLLGAASPVSAQDASQYAWGQLSRTEVTRTSLDSDPSAGATVVVDIGRITVGPGFWFTYKRHQRIQIFRTDAYGYANITLPYHKSERIEHVKAHTLTLDGRRVPVEDGQFYETKTGDWRTLSFAFPEVSPGCVIEYEYELTSRNFYYLRPWVFQNEIPVEYSEMAVRLPEGFEYTAVVNNAEYVVGPDTTEYLSPLHRSEKEREFSKKVRQFTWRAYSLPPLVMEPLVSSILDFRALLDFQIVRYRENHHVWEFVDSWSDLAGQVKKAYAPLLETDDRWPRWDRDLTDLTPNARQKVTARRIYHFVRDSIAMAGDAFAVYDSDLLDARKVLKERRGNAIEKNLLYAALLRHHGISAYPVLISRRSHLRFDRRDHRLEQFDHVITLIEIAGEQMFCETTVPYAWHGYLPPDDQVEAGVVIGYPHDEKIVVDLPAPPVDHVVYADGVVDLRTDGSATGHLELKLGGQAAYEFLCAHADADAAGYLQSEWLDGIIPTNIAITQDSEDVWKPLGVSIDFDWPDAAKIQDDGWLLIKPACVRAPTANPLLTAKRRYPISFDTPWTEDCKITWNVPEGYTLDTRIEPYRSAGDGFEFRVSVDVSNNQVIAQRFWSSNYRDYPVKQFEDLRSMFQTAQSAEGRMILLYPQGQ